VSKRFIVILVTQEVWCSKILRKKSLTKWPSTNCLISGSREGSFNQIPCQSSDNNYTRAFVENWQLREQFPPWRSPIKPRKTALALGKKIKFAQGKILFIMLVHVTSKSTSQPKGEICPPRPHINATHLVSLGGITSHIHSSSLVRSGLKLQGLSSHMRRR